MNYSPPKSLRIVLIAPAVIGLVCGLWSGFGRMGFPIPASVAALITQHGALMIGGFFDAFATSWSDGELDWFEGLLEEQDVDILAWGLGAQPVPERWQGAMMDALQQLDYFKSAN